MSESRVIPGTGSTEVVSPQLCMLLCPEIFGEKFSVDKSGASYCVVLLTFMNVDSDF